MHLWRQLGAIILFAACAAHAAVVYKWTDAEGVVHYSDQPAPGAERIVTGTSPTHGIATTSVGASQKVRQETPKPLARLGYNEISIASPSAEQTFFEAPVPVRLNLSPDLKANHRVTWYLNGSAVENQQPNATQFVMDSLSRGVYTLAATITDADTQESVSSDTVTFYVRQPSILAPQYPKK